MLIINGKNNKPLSVIESVIVQLITTKFNKLLCIGLQNFKEQ